MEARRGTGRRCLRRRHDRRRSPRRPLFRLECTTSKLFIFGFILGSFGWIWDSALEVSLVLQISNPLLLPFCLPFF